MLSLSPSINNGSGEKSRGVGGTDRMLCARTGWLLGLDKASLRLVIGFITEHGEDLEQRSSLKIIPSMFWSGHDQVRTLEHLWGDVM